ncbi:ATP-dependent nuclease [Pseudomonas aeruginosa]|uniref:ATP-dependent nuclease n=2 Tax=Gammaproteobacteria TaxID=1236 RepID=UPI00232E1EAB|nr:AAA family ATPase [Pseudomonas aeruginosa]
MFMSRIRVKNFRSLVDVELKVSDYTALVGLNDSGKSNLLRALNLFFNQETDPGHPLDFFNDFSQHAKTIDRKAKQIEIEIEFSPPKNYSDNTPIIWRKTYRSDVKDPAEELYKTDRSEFLKGSKAEYWVRNIAYEYVPAIRGKHFFGLLKRRLYKTLAATVATNLKQASSTFLANLRQEVKNIEKESLRLLQLKTEFSLPSDLGDLFEALGFDSEDDYTKTALQYRGDGIQGRHVPLIYKFLADQRKKNSSKGKPRAETIWGFEEPENNLELSRQIETAEEFKNYSNGIQILVSTHSPAFYGMAKEAGKISIAIRDSGKTSFVDSISPEDIDSQLGLMAFVEPYIHKAQAERENLIQSIKNLKEGALIFNKPVLYVEGSTDKTIIEAAFKALEIPMNFEIACKEGLNGGANWVADCCIARSALTDVSFKTAALFDDDHSGIEASKRVSEIAKNLGREGRAKIIIIGKNNDDDLVRQVKKCGIEIPINIEELCSINVWRLAESKGWLEERDTLVRDNAGKLNKNTSLADLISEKIENPDVRLLIEHKVKNTKKGSFSKKVIELWNNGSEMPTPSLKTLILEINKIFS